MDGGAKEGDAKDAPKPLTFAEGWAMGTPDAVVEMPTAVEVPASGTVDYTYIVVPTGLHRGQVDREGGSAAGRARAWCITS